MMKFSGCISIRMVCRDSKQYEEALFNIHTLFSCINWALLEQKLDNSQFSTRFHLIIEDFKNFCILFLRNDNELLSQTQILTNSSLKPFFQFLDYVDKIEQITLNDMVLSDYNRYPHFLEFKYDKVAKNNSILIQARQTVKTLKILKCNLLGNFTTHLPKVYPSIEKVVYEDSNFLINQNYGQYENLTEISVLNCSTYKININENSKLIYSKVNWGVPIELLERLINKRAFNYRYIESRIKVLDADVYLGEYLLPGKYFPWKLITSIESCNLRDYETKFSFSMIRKLLISTLQIQNASALPPIKLQILKFEDTATAIQPDPKQSEVEQKLRSIAQKNGLEMVGFDEIVTEQKLTIYFMQIKLQGIEGRQLRLQKIGILSIS
ncbi:hypothetical protein FGO68_gene15570 [Halteria grandinella]|uniref:Uncharacterized protein n=1 Tax=Halteria grandinella TaxID=5974 RepID=A0A8J8T6F5_HALGN|nr:hypothetical protein FGO68_gene15570 [Halteria grandinella]